MREFMKRQLQSTVFPAILAGTLLAACAPAVNEDGIARRTVEEINQAFRDTANTELALSPETATRLGMEEARMGFGFHDRLDDRSQARFERARLLRLELLGRLADLPAIPGDSRLARHLEIVRNEYNRLTTLEAYGYGRYGPGMARPYAADPLSGAWVDVPDLLLSSQPLSNHEDAGAYLDRLAALPGAIEDERRRLMSDAANGVVPPRFVLDMLEARLEAFAAQPVDAHPLLQTFGNVVTTLPPREGRSPNAYREAAARLLLRDVIPAYREFAQDVARLKEDASNAPGVWKLPQGDAYYRDVLAYYTEPGIDPDFLHDQGHKAVETITAELDAAFTAIGLPDGSVTARLELLAASPGQGFDASQEGRAAVISDMQAALARAKVALPDVLKLPPEASLIITRMPAYREAAFSGASYVPATANGSSPGLVQVNLQDLEAWPRFSLPTLLYHEGTPGHHVEASVAAAQRRLPLLRQMIWNNAYGEGWAVYAEDLADAEGLYAGDPLGRIGYLQSILFRAARLVVDTGIHDRKWSRDQAVDYLVTTTGLPRAAMEAEVARYAVWPGQAASYLYGRQRLLDIRARAEAVLGGRFDPAAFNAEVLSGGPRPLSMVEADIEAWYDSLLAR